MIPKGSQRAGGQQLATHLLNEFDNDRVEVAQVRGAIAQDLHGAFAEWSAAATGTRCRKYLYSLSVNPDPEQGPLTREQYADFIERAEEKLGLTGQPRALIFHVKHGREHCHAVWSRIDTEKMRAVQLSHDRQKLRTVVIDFARDHGLDLPGGVTRDRARDDGSRRRAENLAEKQQEDRTGQSRDARMRAVTDAWNESRDGRGLVRALEARGYLLARGNRRAYVVVDRFGEVHSLARQIKGVRTRQVKERLASYPLDRLPDVEKAQAFAREQRETTQTDRAKLKELAENRREQLAAAHAERRAQLDRKRDALKRQHRLERETLAELQHAANRGIADKREASRPRGLLAFLTRITGIRAIKELRERRQDEQRQIEHRRQKQALQRRHHREMRDFSRRYRALSKIETRENRSLNNALRREEFARIARGPKPPRPPTPPTPPLSPPFRRAARSDTPQAPPPALTPEFEKSAAPPEPPPQPPEPITPEFDKAASPPPQPERDRSTGGLSPEFNKRASGADPVAPERGEDEPPPAPSDDDSLSDAFERALKERAARKRKDREQGRDPDKPRGPDRGRGL